jgi:probable HAF family extracellular repeat protein
VKSSSAIRFATMAAVLIAARTAAATTMYHVTELGTIGGTNSEGYGINDSGQVAGSGGTPGGTAYHAFLYSSGVMNDSRLFVQRWRDERFGYARGHAPRGDCH